MLGRRLQTPLVLPVWMMSSHSQIPCPKTATGRQPAADLGRPTCASAASRMLIVDADAAALARVAEMGIFLGFQIATAGDIVDALWFLTKQDFGVVMASNDLPSIDGYQLALKIKRKQAHTAVIIMARQPIGTIDNDRPDAAAVIDGWLLQPFDLVSMREQLHRIGVMAELRKRPSPAP